METRRMLKLQISQLELSNERRLKENKKLKERVERLDDENGCLKAELCNIEQQYRAAMMANTSLTEQWEKMKTDYDEVLKAGRLMERAVEESGRIRKKLSIEEQMLMKELERFGYAFEKTPNELIIHRPEQEETNADR